MTSHKKYKKGNIDIYTASSQPAAAGLQSHTLRASAFQMEGTTTAVGEKKKESKD